MSLTEEGIKNLLDGQWGSHHCPLCDSGSREIHPRTRDREDISVRECRNCGLVYLSSFDHVGQPYESNHGDRQDMEAWRAKTLEDDRRRFGAVCGISRRIELTTAQQGERAADVTTVPYLYAGSWLLDFGCGNGQFVDMAKSRANAVGIDQGDALPDGPFDVVTMFHVLEHLPDPIAVLSEIKKRLIEPDGIIVIEVPHARNSLFALESFRDFSYWSQHLYLFNQSTLRTVIERAGLQVEEMRGFNRYGASNALSFLLHGKPVEFAFPAEIDDSDFDVECENADRTDTLWAVCKIG